MEHNIGPANALLIGSRAWTKDFDAANNGSADWDLIVSFQRLQDLISESLRKLQVSFNSEYITAKIK